MVNGNHIKQLYTTVVVTSAVALLIFFLVENTLIAIISSFIYLSLRSFSTLVIATLEMQLPPENFAPYVFALTQSSFLLGDIVGGALLPLFRASNYMIF